MSLPTPKLAPSLLLLGAAVVTAACGGRTPGPSTPAGAAGSTKAGEATAYLVWSRTGDRARTAWLDAAGRVVAERDGVVLAHEGRLYRLETTTRELRLQTCEEMIGEGAPGGEPATGHVRGLRLVPLGEGAPIVVRPAEVDAEGLADLDAGATLMASLGPVLFLEESVSAYACGAHGDTGVSATVFDLRRGAPIELGPPADLEALTEAALRALAAEVAAEMPAETPEEEVKEVTLGESVPTWAGGRLAMHHLFFTFACYACGDGEWSSYTRATWVAGRAGAAELEDLAASVPPPVAARLESPLPAEGGLEEVRGVSWLPATDAALDAFRGR